MIFYVICVTIFMTIVLMPTVYFLFDRLTYYIFAGGITVQDKQWMKPRHRLVRTLLLPIFSLYVKAKYHIDIENFRNQQNRPYLILYNHQTAFDQFFVDISFKGPIYYLATEDIFSMGFVSSIIRYLVAPIPIKKQTMDLSAVKTCIRVAREGGSIAIAPEGNRTYSGRTEYINPSIAALAKKLALPIVLYRIEGGYGIHPRWSNVVRKGRMRSFVSEVIMPEDYAHLSKDELYDRIRRGLYVNEADDECVYRHTHRAEFLERLIYVCPDCGLSTFESDKDRITCVKCGKTVTYEPTTRLRCVDCDFPFTYVADWYDYQEDYVNRLDLNACCDRPMYRERVNLYEVILYKKKRLIKKDVEICLYGDRMSVYGAEDVDDNWTFDHLSAVTVLGKNKLNIYVDDKVYQIKGSDRFNALKYVHMYHRCKNIQRGDVNGKFLGL